MKRIALAISLAATLLSFAAPSVAQTQQQVRLRGSIDEVAGDKLTYVIRDGATITVLMTPDTRITAVSGTTLSDVKPGSYVGTAAVPTRTACCARSKCISSTRRSAASAKATGRSTSRPRAP